MSSLPQLWIDPRYNPHSRTLIGPSLCASIATDDPWRHEEDARQIALPRPLAACLGDQPGKFQFFDSEITPVSGDTILMMVKRRDGRLQAFVKVLAEVEGRWFLVTEWYTSRLDDWPVEWVAPMVAELVIPPNSTYLHTHYQVNPSNAAELAHLHNVKNKAAIGYLLEHGLRRFTGHIRARRVHVAMLGQPQPAQ